MADDERPADAEQASAPLPTPPTSPPAQAAPVDDGIMLDLGDLPEVPDEPTGSNIEDTFNHPVAYNFAFVGVGQAGGRIAKTFQDIGYARMCAVNTAVADLAELKTFPDSAKLDVGEARGAGKDPHTAARLVADKDEDIFDLLKRCWGDDPDYAFVCLSGAGGTGSGVFAKVVQVAKRYMQEHKKPPRVGVIMALPKDSEGQRSAKNVLYSARTLAKLNVSPVIFIDNEKFKALYGAKVPVPQEKPASNQSTAQILHTFNRLAGTESEDVGGTTFDPADFSRIMDSGVVAFAACNLSKWNTPSDISSPIRDQLKRNVLATIDLTKGNVAGLLYVLSGSAWTGPNGVTVGDLDHGTDMMNRILTKQDAAVFPGVYPAKGKDGIKILAMVGGLPMPLERLQELAVKAGETRDSVAEFLGV
jgi:cell division GTPase FtsZ